MRILAHRFDGRRPIDVVHHKKIEQTVAVVGEPPGRDRPRLGVNARLRRDVFERPIPAIVVKDIAPDTRHEEIRMAVVVVIRDRRAYGKAFTSNAGPVSDIFEDSVARLR